MAKASGSSSRRFLADQRRWAVFISGRGSNLQAMIDSDQGRQIRLVLSNKKSAAGLLKAKRAGIPQILITKQTTWDEIDQILKSYQITHLFLAGFMKLLPAEFIQQWEHRIFNVHPSLLPAFPGLHAMENSYQQAGARLGVSVHRVIAEMDAGPLIRQKEVIVKNREPQFFEQAQLLFSRAEQQSVTEVFHKCPA